MKNLQFTKDGIKFNHPEVKQVHEWGGGINENWVHTVTVTLNNNHRENFSTDNPTKENIEELRIKSDNYISSLTIKQKA